MAVGISVDISDRKRKATMQNTPPTKRTKTDQDADSPSKPDIVQLEEQIKESNRHLNNIPTLYQLARKEAKLQKRKTPAILSLCRVFCRLLADGRLSSSATASVKELAIAGWLSDRAEEYRKLLYRILEAENAAQQELSLTLAMQLVREELANGASGADAVWSGSFQRLIQRVLQASARAQIGEVYVEKYGQQWDDIRHRTFAAANQILSNESEPSPTVTANALALLSKIQLPPTDILDNTFAPTPASKSTQETPSKPPKPKPLSLTTHRKTAQKAWLTLLSRPLTPPQRKTILSNMTSILLPWLPQPTLLMDFLTDSYNTPGSISLLALSGLYTLISEHNLDYPSFYPKLYSLLTPQLLWSKHRSRFLRLMNTFLFSSHLPAALVASFVKKLSRLALHGPPAAIVAIVPWVYNTMKEHPTCTFMLHRLPRITEEGEEITEHGAPDPFDPDEADPMNTGALESCLWELETLRSHWHPHVASLCGIVGQQFTKEAYNLEDFLDHSYGGLLEAEVGEGRRMRKTPVVEAVIPKRVFGEDGQKERLGGLVNDLLSRKDS